MDIFDEIDVPKGDIFDEIKPVGAMKQLGRGVIEGMPSLEGLAKLPSAPGLYQALIPGLPNPEMAERFYEPARKMLLGNTQIPEPAGAGEYIARQGGRAIPTLATLSLAGPVGPAVRGTLKGLPILGKAAGTLGSAATIGAYEAGKSVLGGATPQELVENVKSGALGGAIFHQGGKIGRTLIPGRAGSIAGGAIAGGAMGAPEDRMLEEGLIGGALMATNPAKGKDLTKSRISVASRIVNSLVKPREKELIIGNPGRGISREGLWDNTLTGLRKKVGIRLRELNNMLSNEYAINSDKVANYRDALKPLHELLVDLKKRPGTEHDNIVKVETILKDILGKSVGRFRKFQGLAPEEARTLKQDISSYKKKEFEAKQTGMGPSRIEEVLNEVYRNVDRTMDKVVPGAKELNERVTDLIDANDIISRDIRAKQGKPLLTGRNIFSPAAWEEMLPASVKTGVGALIAPKYKAPSARGSLPLIPKSVGAAAGNFADKTPLLIKKAINVTDINNKPVTITPEKDIYIEPIMKDGKIIKHQVHDGQTINVDNATAERLKGEFATEGGKVLSWAEAKAQRDVTGDLPSDKYYYHVSPTEQIGGLKSKPYGAEKGNVVWLQKGQPQYTTEGYAYAIDPSKVKVRVAKGNTNAFVHEGNIPSDAIIPLGKLSKEGLTQQTLHERLVKGLSPTEGGKVLYHGTSEGGKIGIESKGFNLEEGSNRGVGAGSGNKLFGEGVYFTDTAESSKSYGDSVVKVMVDKNANIKSLSGDDFISILQENKIPLNNKNKITKYFQKQGVDGLYNTDTKETVIFNKDKIRLTPTEGGKGARIR